jgi:4-oxalocrotonate tautomerase
MPLVRIDFQGERSVAYRRAVGDIVYEAMLQILKVPKDDQFEVLAQHSLGGMVADPSYLGIKRSADCLFVQIFLLPGRSVEQKKSFYKAVADGLHTGVGLRREDVFIGLVEVPKENWSFGNGQAQYAT